MEGLIKEGGELIEEDPEPEQLDAGLIAAASELNTMKSRPTDRSAPLRACWVKPRRNRFLNHAERRKGNRRQTHKIAETINVEAMEAEASESRKPGKAPGLR